MWPLEFEVKTESPIRTSEIRMVPCSVKTVVLSAKHAKEPSGPHAPQHTAYAIGFHARGAHAARQAVQAPGAKGPERIWQMRSKTKIETMDLVCMISNILLLFSFFVQTLILIMIK